MTFISLKVVVALEKNNMLNDSIIVFSTDNGGAVEGFNNSNSASNWPLRGVKDTLWEGGVRGAAFVWSPRLRSRGRVSNQMMTIHDWLPTLYSAAGGQPGDLADIDGLNMWPALVHNKPSPRRVILHNIEERRHLGAVRVGNFKLVKGSAYVGDWDTWYGPGRSDLHPPYEISKVRRDKIINAMMLPF